MKRMSKMLILATLALLYVEAGVAQDYKIGTLNALRVINQSPQAEVAKERIEKEFSSREAKIRTMGETLKELEDRLAKDQAIMSESELQGLERKIIAQKRDFKRAQDEYREDLTFRRNEELSEMQKVIAEAIQKVAAANDFDLVLSDGVVYSSKKLDISDLVIAHLKKEYGDNTE